jgi:glycosyltransferase involved in cell wall biosynthesis
MEANSVTGPAKNLIGFCRWLRTPEGAQSGISISIATFTRGAGTDNGAFVEAVRAAGVDLHLIHERFRYDPGSRSQIRKIVTALQPDIIQTHNNKSHLLVKLLPALRHSRLWFAFHHGDTYTDLKQRLFNHVDRVSLRSADRVVTVCKAFVPRLAACGVTLDRVRILHNSAAPSVPVSSVTVSDLRSRLGIGTDEALILMIARFSREKGHLILLHALRRVSSIPHKWKMVLVGTGPEREEITRLAHSLGLSERVLFAGAHADVAPFYAAADLLVLPSLSEGSSNVLLEAMASKTPIIATNVGGSPEIVIHDETGLLVPAGDPTALAGAIARLLSDLSLGLRFAQAALSRAVSEFSAEQYRRRLLGFYAEALETKGIGMNLPRDQSGMN